MVGERSRRQYLQMIAGGGSLSLKTPIKDRVNSSETRERRGIQASEQPWSASITPLAANEKKALAEVTVKRNLITKQPTVDNPVLRSRGPLKLKLLNENTRISRAFPLPSKKEESIELAINVGTIALGVAGIATGGGTAIAATVAISGLLADAYNLVLELMEQNEIKEKNINYLEFREMDNGEDTFLIELERIDQQKPVYKWDVTLEYDAWRDYRGNQSDVKLSLTPDSATMQACRTADAQITIDGKILKPDGTPAAEDTIVISNEGGNVDRTNTNRDGSFSFTVPQKDAPYTISYFQVFDTDASTELFEARDEAAAFPNDGSPDMYTLSRVESAGSNEQEFNLPTAHEINITVADNSGDPVPEAKVNITHQNNGAETLLYDRTNGNGEFVLYKESDPGIELTGEITIEVQPPEDSTRFSGSKTRNLLVDESKTIEITLDS